jgi:hypothetical protein
MGMKQSPKLMLAALIMMGDIDNVNFYTLQLVGIHCLLSSNNCVLIINTRLTTTPLFFSKLSIKWLLIFNYLRVIHAWMEL